MEHAYANFESAGPDAAEFAENCSLGKRGLFIQFMRDASARMYAGMIIQVVNNMV